MHEENQDVEISDVSRRALTAALEAMDVESAAIQAARDAVRDALPTAMKLIMQSHGRVIVSGLGKSGHIGSKIAATLASTGTPAQFVHSAEALHGDSGMAIVGDVAILISYSGETLEVCQFGAMLAARSVPVIALTEGLDSTLGRLATVVLSVSVEREADPLNLAPTASTTVALAVGDALAAGLMAASGFNADDFARHHPGGSLGSKLGTGAVLASDADLIDERPTA
jgi:arabinose-5-phosphate isomerase